ncbi:MAG: trehalose/maltose transport system permease protein, partial [Actinomycetota bacterium]|nr:trehalose/maltose transport system permease protein [Actinomycetota bacterium]
MTLAKPTAESTARGPLPPTTGPKRNKIKTGEGRLAFLLVMPTIALLGLIVGYPIVKAIYNSFLSDTQKINPTTGLLDPAGAWTGLTNYKHW